MSRRRNRLHLCEAPTGKAKLTTAENCPRGYELIETVDLRTGKTTIPLRVVSEWRGRKPKNGLVAVGKMLTRRRRRYSR